MCGEASEGGTHADAFLTIGGQREFGGGGMFLAVVAGYGGFLVGGGVGDRQTFPHKGRDID